MSQDQKTTNKQSRSTTRQLTRELHPEELDAIASISFAGGLSRQIREKSLGGRQIRHQHLPCDKDDRHSRQAAADIPILSQLQSARLCKGSMDVPRNICTSFMLD
jgi:hypothetical protein